MSIDIRFKYSTELVIGHSVTQDVQDKKKMQKSPFIAFRSNSSPIAKIRL